jgi:hypothetical protein
MNMPLVLLNRRRRGFTAFSPSTLFALAEPGVWYDPSDLTTLFTDTAGTTPVTTPGNTVGLMLDKSGNGNHATQATAAARPTYSIEPVGGRRNLLLATDTMATQSATVTAVAHTLAFTGTGTVTLTGASIAGPLIGTGAGNRVTLTFTPTAGSLTMTVAGSVTLAQLELGSTATNYQRVTTQYDVTEAGVASVSYLYFDGGSDAMATSTITPGIDKVQVFAGVRKLSDAADGTIVELSSTSFSNNGAVALFAPSGANNAILRSKGTIQAVAAVTVGFVAPISGVLSGLGDILGNSATIRLNGSVMNTITTDQGTGNFLAYPLYLGARAGTSLPFNGHFYSLIARFGANLDAPTIASTEAYVAGKTGITI